MTSLSLLAGTTVVGSVTELVYLYQEIQETLETLSAYGFDTRMVRRVYVFKIIWKISMSNLWFFYDSVNLVKMFIFSGLVIVCFFD